MLRPSLGIFSQRYKCIEPKALGFTQAATFLNKQLRVLPAVSPEKILEVHQAYHQHGVHLRFG